jgi:hypothetical protein
MDDLLARLEGDLVRIRALYRFARRRGGDADLLAQLESFGKGFRTELERFRATWDPAERKEAVLAAGRVLGRIDGWVLARGGDFAATWRRGEAVGAGARGSRGRTRPNR